MRPRWDRRQFLQASAAGALAVTGTQSSAEPPAPERRNVVLIVADDLSLDLGCYGNPIVKTPNIDALAKEGVRFTDAYATVASCSASRGVLYTGLYTHANGQFGHAHMPANLHTYDTVRSLPRVLEDKGYRTGIIGKVHVLPRSVYPFDYQPETDDPGGRHGRDTSGFDKDARKFFASCQDQPFLLVVGFHDPHRAGRGFGNERDSNPDRHYDPAQLRLPYYLPNQPEAREDLAEYFQAISRLDEGVGLILKALEDAHQRDNTLIIFVSDNGMPFPGAKTTLYDPGVHLPMIVRSPTQKKRGLTNRAMASWIDITPTILDWTGAEKLAAMTGRSVLPVLEQENPKDWDTIFGSFVFHEITNYYPMRMIRTRRHKYILNLAHALDFPFASDLWASKTWQGVLKRGDKSFGDRRVEFYVHRPKVELYDLENDPRELKNIAGHPDYAAIEADLRTQLKIWQRKTKDPWLVKDVYE